VKQFSEEQKGEIYDKSYNKKCEQKLADILDKSYDIDACLVSISLKAESL
jgi:hypothetical protein